MPKSNFKIDELTLVLIVAFLALIVSVHKTNKPVEMEAEKISELILNEHDVSFANNGVVDENKLKEIQSMNYKEFKNSLKAKNDFCVYIEDGNGNVILSKGSNKLNKDGMLCKE